MKRYTLLWAALASLFLFAGCSQDNPADPAVTGADEATALDKHGWGGDTVTYQVIVRNLTPATGPGASQPFSPPILATHHHRMHIFQKGHRASEALAMVAEDAMSDALLGALGESARVHDFKIGDGVVLPGGETMFEIEASGRMNRLSAVFMLVNTNDAFGGLDGVRLPRHGEKTYRVQAWDAGSEVNTEALGDIPGPCCGSPGEGMDENRRIRRHRGLSGDGDLDPAIYGWDGRVATVTVKRLD